VNLLARLNSILKLLWGYDRNGHQKTPSIENSKISRCRKQSTFLSKKKASMSLVFDMLRFRIVTATVEDIIPTVSYLSSHLFPFNFTVPGESHNSIFTFQNFARNHSGIKADVPVKWERIYSVTS